MFTGICIRFLAVALACCHPTPVSVTCLTLVTEAVSHLVNMLVKRTVQYCVLSCIVDRTVDHSFHGTRPPSTATLNTVYTLYRPHLSYHRRQVPLASFLSACALRSQHLLTPLASYSCTPPLRMARERSSKFGKLATEPLAGASSLWSWLHTRVSHVACPRCQDRY